MRNADQDAIQTAIRNLQSEITPGNQLNRTASLIVRISNERRKFFIVRRASHIQEAGH